MPREMNARVLVVDDDRDEGELLQAMLEHRGCTASFSDGAEAALRVLGTEPVDVVLTDVRMSGMSGLELCARMRVAHPDLPVVVVTGHADVDTAIAALRAGAWDFVTKPLHADQVAHAVARAAEHARARGEVRRLRQALAAARPVSGIVGDSPPIRAIAALLGRIADGDATVLITGESGTGKELVARAVHDLGPRRDEPFVAINCGAVPANLLESELFGHVKGAFTDARRDRPGVFVQAGNGTIFLDEIGEMPMEMQVKLLRVLQERVVRPVGGDDEQPFAARVVCATNRDLEVEVEEGRFRQDLYYRVNVVTVEVPPLRDRGDDIVLLAHHFLRQIATRTGKAVTTISADAIRRLLDYDWPGNVRELENGIERAVALAQQSELSVADLPAKVRDHQTSRVMFEGDAPAEFITLDEMARRYVRRVIEAAGGNKTQAAKVLGIDRRSLYRRLDTAAQAEQAEST